MKLGFHMSIAKGFDWVRSEVKRLECEAVQVFVKNPRSWKKRNWSDEEGESVRRLMRDFPVIAHLSYLPNLAKADLDPRNLEGFQNEVESCVDLGIKSLVVHCGSREDKEKGIGTVSMAVSTILRRYDIEIILENASGRGNALGGTIEEIARIAGGVVPGERVFLCLDTAHLFQAGYDIRTPKALYGVIHQIERKVGAGRIAMFHLNDSKTARGSTSDRHWHIGQGTIGLAAFEYLINEKRFAHLPGIMETPKMGDMDTFNMKTMKSLLSPLVPCSSS